MWLGISGRNFSYADIIAGENKQFLMVAAATGHGGGDLLEGLNALPSGLPQKTPKLTAFCKPKRQQMRANGAVLSGSVGEQMVYLDAFKNTRVAPKRSSRFMLGTTTPE